MNNTTDHNFEYLSTLTHEEIYKHLLEIKREICWLENAVSLTKDQWQIFHDVKNNVKSLFGDKHV